MIDRTGNDSDRLVVIVVELEKVRERYTEVNKEILSNELLAWSYMLTRGYSEEEGVVPLLKEFPTMEEFAKQYGYASNDPKLKRAYEDALSAERDYNMRQDYYARLKREAQEAGLEEGRAKGREEGRAEGHARGLEEGREEGRAEERDSIAARLRELGVDEGTIAKAVEQD